MIQSKNSWSDQDFFINRYFWQNKTRASMKIRYENLLLMTSLLNEMKIFNFLEGKTLLYLFKLNELSIFDTDEDIGIFVRDYEKLLQNLDILEKSGFNLIRDNSDIISFERNYRYIDICIFKELNDFEIGYSNKAYKNIFYKDFVKLKVRGSYLNISAHAEDLLTSRYENNFVFKYKIRKIKRNIKIYITKFYEFISFPLSKTIKLIPKKDRENFLNLGIMTKYTSVVDIKDIYIMHVDEDRKSIVPLIESKHYKILNLILNKKKSMLPENYQEKDNLLIYKNLKNVLESQSSFKKDSIYVLNYYGKYFKKRFIIFEPFIESIVKINDSNSNLKLIIV